MSIYQKLQIFAYLTGFKTKHFFFSFVFVFQDIEIYQSSFLKQIVLKYFENTIFHNLSIFLSSYFGGFSLNLPGSLHIYIFIKFSDDNATQGWSDCNLFGYDIFDVRIKFSGFSLIIICNYPTGAVEKQSNGNGKPKKIVHFHAMNYYFNFMLGKFCRTPE